MKKTLMVFALLGTFTLGVFAQDATKPDAAASPDTATTTTKKATKKHSKKHHKGTKKAATDTAAPATK